MVHASSEEAARPVGDSARGQHRGQSTVRIEYLFTAAALMTIGTVLFLIAFVESVLALQGVYQWYPQFVAQQWFIYDEVFTIFTFLGMLFGTIATSLMLSRRSLTGTLTTGLLCTTSGAGVFVTSLIAPLAVLWEVLYNFLPLFLIPLLGTLLFYYARLHGT